MTRFAPWIAVATAGLAHAQDGGTPFLHGVALDSRVPRGTGWADARLSMQAPGDVPLFLRRRSARADAGVVTFELAAAAEATDAPVARHKAATWLVDFSEKTFTPVFAELTADAGTKPDTAALTSFTERFIARKSMRRGFDLASQVARSREGDCTEHAVFLAALLRHAKVPARVMLGIVLVSVEGVPMAFGHAWAEVWQGKRWAVADAAIPASYAPLYLPTDEIVDEGPGFSVALVPAVQQLGVKGLTLEPR